jgi:hypothetical protein
MTPVALSAPPVGVASPALEPLAQFNPSDLDRLRALVQAAATQTANPAGPALALDAPAATRSFGDSILEGMLRFTDNYKSSMSSIETRLQGIVKTDSAGLSNFSEILALQVDVAKWSMSVMGVDNASKAGSNTIKELSRGG